MDDVDKVVKMLLKKASEKDEPAVVSGPPEVSQEEIEEITKRLKKEAAQRRR